MKESDQLRAALTRQFGVLLQENFVELWGYGSPNRDATGHFVFTIGTTKDGSYKIASALSYSRFVEDTGAGNLERNEWMSRRLAVVKS
jgi:hypothetical protein